MFSILVLDLTMFSRSKKYFLMVQKFLLEEHGILHYFVSCFIENVGEGDDLKTSKVPIPESPLSEFDLVEILLENTHEFIDLEKITKLLNSHFNVWLFDSMSNTPLKE